MLDGIIAQYGFLFQRYVFVDTVISHASIKDTYYELTLENGDTLEIVLVVTDNLGRTEQYEDSMNVQDGELQRKPAAAPVVPVG